MNGKTTWATLPDEMVNRVIPELINTFYMVFAVAVIASILGLVVGVALAVTENVFLKENKVLNVVIDTIVNTILAFPFIILAIYIMPFTRLLVGTALGPTASIVPLSIVKIAFMAKIYRDALREVSPYVIEAAKSYGASTIHIIRIMIKEAVPSFVSGINLMLISALNYASMAGALGGGGIGALAIIYGYQRHDYLLMFVLAAILVVVVHVMQAVGEKVYVKLK